MAAIDDFEGERKREALARKAKAQAGVEVRAVNGSGPLCDCGLGSALHVRPIGERQGRFYCAVCVVAALPPVSGVGEAQPSDRGNAFPDADTLAAVKAAIDRFPPGTRNRRDKQARAVMAALAAVDFPKGNQ